MNARERATLEQTIAGLQQLVDESRPKPKAKPRKRVVTQGPKFSPQGTMSPPKTKRAKRALTTGG